MTIKHIVLAGGGPVGLLEYGILKELTLKKKLDYKNIKSIYTTSIGGYFGLLYLLNLDWDWMDDFLIKRPWQNLINFSINDYINIFYTKGFIDIEFTKKVIAPLLFAKDLSIDITLKELYELTKIDFHLFTTNLNKFIKVDLSYKTHPDLKIYEALHMTTCIPIMVKPLFYKNSYYIDGGIFVNSPINECCINEKANINEILLLINDKESSVDMSNNFYKINNYDFSDTSNYELYEDKNIINFFISMLKIIIGKINSIESNENITIKNSINVSLTPYTVDIKYWKYVFTNSEERSYLINLGVKLANEFINNNILDNSNVIIDNSNVIIDNSNVIIDNSNNILDNITYLNNY